MSNKGTAKGYGLLAEYYDTVFTFHHPWGEAARRGILGPLLPGVQSACDIACGTGTTAVAMAGRGITTYAVDASAVMCRKAREKARHEAVRLTVLRADMRSFRLPEKVDLVTCEFDALNHVPRKSDLARVARSVARALKPGGHFYFDVNNRLSFQKLWPLTLFIDKPQVAVVLHGGYDRRRDKAWANAEWFIRDGKAWRRRRERVEEVCWSDSEIRRALGEAGFDRVRAWDAAPFFKGDPMMQPGIRTFYLARNKLD